MRSRRAILLLGLPLLALSLSAAAPNSRTDPTKDPVREVFLFRLTDPRSDKVVDLKETTGVKGIVVLFLGTQCPINNDFLEELNRLHQEYASKGVRFVGVNANRQDSPTAVAEHAKKHAMRFPIVKDPRNEIADRFKARRTPEAFLISPRGKVLYQGRIDDQFGIGYRRAGKPTRRNLACAIDEMLAGKPISKPRTEVAGCFISRVKKAKIDGKVTYAKQISRIMQKNCQDCHRRGQIGPMSLQSYNSVSAWADTIGEVVAEGRMPPWHADPRHGKWSNERRLSKEDKELILTWIKEGMPRGDDADLPAPRTFPADWQIGKPDLILRMPREFAVPAETPKGGIPYKYFWVETNFKEDRWVHRAEARAGATEVVHHIIIFIVPKGEFLRMDGEGSVLTGLAPGDMPMMLEAGYAKKIPAGARLVFQMHYTPNGKGQKDRSSVGMIFTKKPPKHRVLTKPIHNGWFFSRLISIPPGAANFEMEASEKFATKIEILGFMPHMHLRGKDFLFEAIGPSGTKETLLSVPAYNFNWQSVYRPVKPVPLAKGSTLRCLAHYDNSAKNPHNPDPKKRVFWGDQTWEEMMVGWIDYVELQDPTK